MTQRRFKAVFMRGGSSKGVFFHRSDVPQDRQTADQLFLSALGSPDPYGRQLDGMGGGISSLSKVVMIAPSQHEHADVDYTFAQVAVSDPVVDFGSTCGNLSSAVGPFAVDEKLVEAGDGERLVRIFNTNTSIMIHSRFQVSNGVAAVAGDYEIAGVSGSGSRISLDFLDPGGSFTSGVLPTGNVVDSLTVDGLGEIKASLVDVTNPAVFVDAADFGISAAQSPQQLDDNGTLMRQLEDARRQAAVLMGLAETAEQAGAASPRIALVSAPQSFVALNGLTLTADQMHINVRMLSMGNVHRAVPLTGGMCLAAACRIEGTVPAQMCVAGDDVLIGQPSGVLDVGADVVRENNGWQVRSTRVYRTARRLMEGNVLVP